MKRDGKIISRALKAIGLISVLILFGPPLLTTLQEHIPSITVGSVVQAASRKATDITSKALEKSRQGYEKALRSFNKQRAEHCQELEEGKKVLSAFREAMRTAQNKNAEFAKVYDEWEEVASQVSQVREKFTDLASSADYFYDNLDLRANGITAKHLRTITQQRIIESRKSYISRLNRCEEGIRRLDNINMKVNNTLLVLEISYNLGALEAELERTFQEIDAMVETILTALETLTRESKELLTIRIDPPQTEVQPTFRDTKPSILDRVATHIRG